jgi:hypothetical protein
MSKTRSYTYFFFSKGPLACTRIQLNKGVCGSSWGQCKTIVVPNVHQFPGHIGINKHKLSSATFMIVFLSLFFSIII